MVLQNHSIIKKGGKSFSEHIMPHGGKMKYDIINMYNKYIINQINALFLRNNNTKEIDELYLRTLQNIEKSISEDLEILDKKKKLAD